MAGSEVYRVEIPIIVDDQTDKPLQQAERKISRLERAAQRETERIRKHFQHIAKYQIEPVMKVRDQLTASVFKADKLIKKLGMEQASPLIAAQDRVTSVITRIDAAMKALEKGDVTVFAEMQGPLTDEIVKAKAALSVLNNVKAGPVAELRGELFGQLTKAMSQIDGLDGMLAVPEATLRERVTWRVREISSSLRGLTSRAWQVTLQVKDKVSGVLRGITGGIRKIGGLITSPLTLLGVGGGVGGLTKFGIDMVVERENVTMAFETLLGSAEAAVKRVEELTEFAGQTPFLRDEIYEASRILEVFTRGALSTSKGLKIVGDVAAGTGQEYKEVSMWIGRLYDAMASGRPVGEMTARLQEMGAIGGKERALLEQLAKSGRNIAQTWPQAEKVFARFEGQMERMSEGLGNMMLSVKSFFRETVLLRWGKGIEAELRPILATFRRWRKEHPEQVQAIGDAIERIARTGINRVVEFFKRGYGQISDIIRDESLTWDHKLVIAFERMFDAANKWMKGPGGEKISEGIQTVGGILATAIEGLTPVIVPPAVNLGIEIAKGVIGGFWEMITSNPVVAAAVGAWGGFKIGSAVSSVFGLPGALVVGTGGAILGGGTALIRREVQQRQASFEEQTRYGALQSHISMQYYRWPEPAITPAAAVSYTGTGIPVSTDNVKSVPVLARTGVTGNTNYDYSRTNVTNHIQVSVKDTTTDPDKIAEAIAVKLESVYKNTPNK